MIDLYTWATPNGRKASIMLEECRLRYRVHPVNLEAGEQRAPEFRKLAPTGRIPVIVDRPRIGRPVTVFESGAILIYLAEKTGKFLPSRRRARARVLKWVMWQVGSVGPTLGQLRHFADIAPEKSPYAIARFHAEAVRLIGVLDGALAHDAFIAGTYSIADMMLYPWMVRAMETRPQILNSAGNVARWMKRIGARGAVKRGMAIPDLSRPGDRRPGRAALVDSS